MFISFVGPFFCLRNFFCLLIDSFLLLVQGASGSASQVIAALDKVSGLDALSKANVMLQAYVSGARPDCPTLRSDAMYVGKNGARIARALFEISMHRGWGSTALRTLELCKAIDHQLWWATSDAVRNHGRRKGKARVRWPPLRQFSDLRRLPAVLTNLEEKAVTIARLRDLSATEIGHLVHHVRAGKQVLAAAANFPLLKLTATLHPITRSILRMKIAVETAFVWKKAVHGESLSWWIWVEDSVSERIYHSELVRLRRSEYSNDEEQNLEFVIPVEEPLPSQFHVHAVNDRWVRHFLLIALLISFGCSSILLFSLVYSPLLPLFSSGLGDDDRDRLAAPPDASEGVARPDAAPRLAPPRGGERSPPRVRSALRTKVYALQPDPNADVPLRVPQRPKHAARCTDGVRKDRRGGARDLPSSEGARRAQGVRVRRAA